MSFTQPAVRSRGQQAARSRYVSDTVATVSPAALVTMLYDGLVADLQRAEQCIARADVAGAHDRLVHAQAIVLELRAGLKPELWSGGPALASLYMFFTQELVQANIAKDASRVRNVRALVEPLRDAWHQAANQVRASSSMPAQVASS